MHTGALQRRTGERRESFTIALAPSLRDKLGELAEESGVSRSHYVVRVLSEHVAEKQPA